MVFKVKWFYDFLVNDKRKRKQQLIKAGYLTQLLTKVLMAFFQKVYDLFHYVQSFIIMEKYIRKKPY